MILYSIFHILRIPRNFCREELAAAIDFLRVLEGVKLWPVAGSQLAGKQADSKLSQGQDVNKQLSLLKMLLRSEIERLQASVSA